MKKVFKTTSSFHESKKIVFDILEEVFKDNPFKLKVSPAVSMLIRISKDFIPNEHFQPFQDDRIGTYKDIDVFSDPMATEDYIKY